jgi:hypothetical protein
VGGTRFEIPDHRDLRADCAACAALCCVAPGFEVSAEFPIRKPAGEACPNLTGEFRCGIHVRLRDEGFSGCVAYDCFGAGQRATRAFDGRTWRTEPAVARAMFRSFDILRGLHEILWYTVEATGRLPEGTLRDEVGRVHRRTLQLAASSPEALVDVDVETLRKEVGVTLEEVSRVIRGRRAGRSLRGADLAHRRLVGADLRGADLRSACLIRADLTGADLRLADLLGADLRGANVRSANLADALFVTQAQVQAADGDSRTTLPPALTRPADW